MERGPESSPRVGLERIYLFNSGISQMSAWYTSLINECLYSSPCSQGQATVSDVIVNMIERGSLVYRD